MPNDIKELLLIAGKGIYPLLLAEGAKRKGIERLVVLAFRGETTNKLERIADQIYWLRLGQLESFFSTIEQTGIKNVVMAGQLTPTNIFFLKMDNRMRSFLNSIPVKTSHTVFTAVVKELEKNGINVLPAYTFMEEHLASAGIMTHKHPSDDEWNDIKLGEKVIKCIGSVDIGQTVVIKNGLIIAVEALEGTDECIKRAAKLAGRGIVVVKLPRDFHDSRFDIPVIGEITVKLLHKVRASSLAVRAGKCLFLEKDKLIEMANNYNIAFVGLE